MFGIHGETLGTSKLDRKYKDKNENMDTKTNRKFKILINGEQLLKREYDSYFAAVKAAENLVKDSNDYFDVLEK